MAYSDLDESDSEFESIQLNSGPKVPPVKNWDKFREIPPKIDTGSAAVNPWFKRAEQCLLVLAYFFTLLAVITASVVSKGTTFFMLSQVSVNKKSNLPFCNSDGSTGVYIPNAGDTSFEVDFQCALNYSVPAKKSCDYSQGIERSAWLWCLFFAYAAPQIGSFFRSLRFCLFKFQHMPKVHHFLFVCFMELCHTAGLALLVFIVLPGMDTLRGLVLTAGFATIPSFLLLLTRIQKNSEGKSKISWLWLFLDIPALLAQLSAAVIWPTLQYANGSTSYHEYPWAIPVALVLVSCGWWETYAEENTGGIIGRWLWEVKKEMLDRSRYFTYIIVTPLKIATFFGGLLLSSYLTGTVTNNNPELSLAEIFFKEFLVSFGNHTYRVLEVIENSINSGIGFDEGFKETSFYDIPISDSLDYVYILVIQISTSYGAYIFAKFASKVQIQTFSFAFPITCVIPVCITFLISGCGMRSTDKCAFVGIIPNNLFYVCPEIGDFLTYTWEDDMWIFLIWFLSYIWITLHIWYPKSPRLASTEQIFGTPWYEALFIDQSLMLNRRKDGDAIVTAEELEFELGEKENLDELYSEFPKSETSKTSSVKNTDKISRIYACATMWHENKEEMMEMLKSLYRIDMDYSARRLAQKYLGIVDQDYYEWETHILFDDCMEVGDNPEEEQVINKFVRLLVETMNEAGSHAYGRKIKVKPCRKYPTPYGGRLVWTLPGKTKIVCHLKDKDKIRHKKRWSQCMYMYYLLGYKLMELPISDDRKDAMAENTYILALDGDIDFQPEAIIRLVDLMKKNKNVGAACGRIHPTGSGYMPWYQIFEYAVGHWLQKATEHILGCVLCSPGCFSLFRGKALMDDNVMRKYTTVSTEPRHYVQYDQGEDRWLCTLLLQRGWRVEYSAASDAYTGK
jgi:chitin synthase